MVLLLNPETALVATANVVSLSALVMPRHRSRLVIAAAALFWLSLAWLVWHLVADHFYYRYVWLYSGVGLPWYLKVANVWGGDEGTLLFIASLLATVAIGLRGRCGWTLPGIMAFTLAFGIATLVWNPFSPTPAAQLAELPYRGMNAHLMVVWMALHPPLLFLAYVLLIAPAGAALGALVGASNDFKPVADRYLRFGWLLLTLGIATGMWWAFEDFTFGQVWHWDPVQTSVFAVWALATAVVHGLRRYRASTAFVRVLPLLSLLTVVAILISMAVTRNGLLQSSHRYVGETSAPLFALLIVVVLVVTLAGLVLALRRRLRPHRSNTLHRWIYIAILLFCVIALIALSMLAYALVAAWMQWSRAEHAKPFFEMLFRWSHSGELEALRRTFDSWDVDGYRLNRALAPLGVATGVVGGHVFFALTVHRSAWVASVLALALALTTPWWWQPLDHWFAGAGMTSQQTVAIFYWLDALLVAALYFMIAAATWLLVQFRRRLPARRVWFALPVTLVHVGAMIAVIAIIFATVLDRFSQAELTYPDALGSPQPMPGGFTVTVDTDGIHRGVDGGRRDPDAAGFQAVARVELTLNDGSSDATRIDGQVLYRDTRVLPSGLGAVRELCRILDYRYARYTSDGRTRLDPFIYRGLWRDIQVWVPPAGFEEAEDEIKPAASGGLIVIRVFPLMAWLWIGLAMVVVSAVVLTFDVWLHSSRWRKDG